MLIFAVDFADDEAGLGEGELLFELADGAEGRVSLPCKPIFWRNELAVQVQKGRLTFALQLPLSEKEIALLPFALVVKLQAKSKSGKVSNEAQVDLWVKP